MGSSFSSLLISKGVGRKGDCLQQDLRRFCPAALGQVHGSRESVLSTEHSTQIGERGGACASQSYVTQAPYGAWQSAAGARGNDFEIGVFREDFGPGLRTGVFSKS